MEGRYEHELTVIQHGETRPDRTQPHARNVLRPALLLYQRLRKRDSSPISDHMRSDKVHIKRVGMRLRWPTQARGAGEPECVDLREEQAE